MNTNSELVKGLYEAFARGDVMTVLGAFHPDIEWWEADNFLYADGNPYRGPEAVATGVFQRIVADVENFTVSPGKIHDAGETVVVEGRYTGAMQATGTPVNAQFVHVWTVRGGQVTHFQQYTDTLQWDTAAGS